MADCQCNIENGMLSPGVFNIKQFSNNTDVMRWTVSSRYLHGEIDLADADYDAYLILCIKGRVDEISLKKSVFDDTLQLLWEIGNYATSLTGYVSYQIVFRNSKIGTLGVIGADDANKEANGEYKILNEAAEGTARVYTNESGYRIVYESNHWQLQDDEGSNIDYQVTPSVEPYCGAWKKIAVSNNVSATWYSNMAVMYISESIAADEYIVANFPTILRQVWEKVRHLIISSGASTATVPVTESNWLGDESPYCIDIATLGGDDSIPYGAEIASIVLFKGNSSDGYSDIANVKIEQTPSGKTYVYSPEKVTGKAVILIKGGTTYSTSGDVGDADVTLLVGDKLPIQIGSPVSIKGYVDDKLGEVNAILDQINGVEV